MKYPKILKKAKKSDKDRTCFYCKYWVFSDKCPNKDIRRTDGICSYFKWCATMKTV